MTFKPDEHFMKLKGNDYLPVVWRVVWVREEHPDAQIETEVVFWDHDTHEIMVRAVVVLPKTGARATGHCVGTLAEFKFGYAEKAETQAIGRALALLGYGTAFAGQDLDEGERVADSPLTPKNAAAPMTPSVGAAQPPGESGGHGNDPDPAPAPKAPQTPAQGFVGVAASALTQPGGAASGRRGVESQTRDAAPPQRPTPLADPHAALRAEVVALCSVAGTYLEQLRTAAGGTMPQEWTEEQLRKALPWLRRRLTVSAQLSARMASARSDAEVQALLQEARAAKDQRTISQVEYVGLQREAQTRTAALSGPLTAGAGLGVAS